MLGTIMPIHVTLLGNFATDMALLLFIFGLLGWDVIKRNWEVGDRGQGLGIFLCDISDTNSICLVCWSAELCQIKQIAPLIFRE